MHTRRDRPRASVLIGLALALLWPASAPSGVAAQGSVGAGGAFTRDVLPNGLTVLVEERPGSGLVAVEVAVLAGARFENGPTAGAAAFLEQYFQEGTPTRPTRGDVVRAITSRGGDLEVDATWERVRLAAEMASEDLDVAVDVLADMLLRSTFARDRFEPARARILQELAQREDTPSSRLYDVAEATALGDPEVRYLPTGSVDGVRQLTYERLRAYRDARVVSGNTIVAVAGDVRRDDVLPRIANAFGAMPAGPRQRPVALPRGPVPQLVERTAGSEQSNLALAARTPPVGARDRAALVVLSGILGGGARRLYDEIRDRRGLAYDTGAALVQMRDAGVFLATAGTDPSNTAEVTDLLRDAVARLRATPPTETEVAQAIAYFVDGQIVDLETNSARANDLTRRETIYGVAPPRVVFLRELLAVRPADVQAAARRYLSPQRLTTVVLRPE